MECIWQPLSTRQRLEKPGRPDQSRRGAPLFDRTDGCIRNVERVFPSAANLLGRRRAASRPMLSSCPAEIDFATRASPSSLPGGHYFRAERWPAELVAVVQCVRSSRRCAGQGWRTLLAGRNNRSVLAIQNETVGSRQRTAIPAQRLERETPGRGRWMSPRVIGSAGTCSWS